MFQYKGNFRFKHRKIVHIPKKDLYDDNGLFKGVGTLADRKFEGTNIGPN
jgi:hypothetical protein